MNISLHIREIANGVLVSTSYGGFHNLVDSGQRAETFYPNLTEAYAVAPTLLAAAHAEAVEAHAREEGASRQKQAEYERVRAEIEGGGRVAAPASDTDEDEDRATYVIGEGFRGVPGSDTD